MSIEIREGKFQIHTTGIQNSPITSLWPSDNPKVY